MQVHLLFTCLCCVDLCWLVSVGKMHRFVARKDADLSKMFACFLLKICIITYIVICFWERKNKAIEQLLYFLSEHYMVWFGEFIFILIKSLKTNLCICLLCFGRYSSKSFNFPLSCYCCFSNFKRPNCTTNKFRAYIMGSLNPRSDCPKLSPSLSVKITSAMNLKREKCPIIQCVKQNCLSRGHILFAISRM